MLMLQKFQTKKIKYKNINNDLVGLDKLNQIRSVFPQLHVDYTSRIQTVNEDHNPKYYNLVKNLMS